MRNRYIITYDISEDERRDKVFKVLRGHGDHIQYSVFRCDISETERVSLVAQLHPLIDHKYDQVLMIDLGPVEGRASTCVDAIGRKYIPPERTVVVI